MLEYVESVNTDYGTGVMGSIPITGNIENLRYVNLSKNDGSCGTNLKVTDAIPRNLSVFYI